MSTVKLSDRNTPHTMQGAVDPIKLTATTRITHVPTPNTNQTPEAGQSPTGQAPEATAAPAATQEDQISSKFAALARKEKAMRQKWQEMAAQEQEVKAIKEELAKQKSYRERLKSNPLDVLNEEGITYDQLVKQAVNPPNQEVLSLKQELESLKGIINKQSEETQNYQKSQREQAEKQISMDVKDLIGSNSAYETVKDFGYEEAVTKLIVKTYDEEGKLLDISHAAQQVEDFLRSEVDRINGIPSVKKRLQPQSTETLPNEVAQKQPAPTAESRQLKTLSRSGSSTTQAPRSSRSWAERKAAAIAKAVKE